MNKYECKSQNLFVAVAEFLNWPCVYRNLSAYLTSGASPQLGLGSASESIHIRISVCFGLYGAAAAGGGEVQQQ